MSFRNEKEKENAELMVNNYDIVCYHHLLLIVMMPCCHPLNYAVTCGCGCWQDHRLLYGVFLDNHKDVYMYGFSAFGNFILCIYTALMW